MAKDFAWRQPPTEESVSRLVNFTDAVAGIAVTLLILPLLEIEPPEQDQTIWTVLDQNWGLIFSFLLSFVITLGYWRRHHRLMDGLRSFSPLLVALNGAWLLALVFLQFPSEILGQVGPGGGVLTVYAGTLAVVTWVGVAMAMVLRAHPDIMPPERRVEDMQIRWAAITAGYLTLISLAGLVAPQPAIWGLLGLVPLGWLESWQMARTPPSGGAGPHA